MTGPAHTSPEAIEAVARALVHYGEAEGAVIASTDIALRQVINEVDAELTQRAHKLESARAALASCRREHGNECAQEVRAYAQAEAHVARAMRARAIVREAETAYHHARVRHEAAVNGLVEGGRARLRMNARHISAFLERGHSETQGPPSPRGTGPMPGADVPVAVAGAPPGYFLVPLSLIDDGSDAVAGPSEFMKGYSPEDLSWAIDCLHSVVIPAMAMGEGPTYFQDRDAREGRVGTRSYTDTYLGFFGVSAIKLNATEGGMHTVENGRHRIWVARAKGDSAIVARLR